jgi:hypothetical protein
MSVSPFPVPSICHDALPVKWALGGGGGGGGGNFLSH